ncbi:MAG: hypothetical protein A3A33_00520 [Candidatus Yanofskybacteria bacterium RIFCSPLOWO2_01_FULL_49_25]|uniref:Uncharacterized protein n=1 Tax=Candidatus Yanofskybacteria bacterium RIFCSPLOWO2_01_FULL_49_25 TaxID=1802701 RepID=A0A1F8GQV9_9BACT|nr:MAG: hypothetical protein A3A33_00520 [Candidatus Yanofskybacteria bacterium RIFCSPLOWO2_01_FULL_49_25]
MSEQGPDISIQAERQERQHRIDELLGRIKLALKRQGFDAALIAVDMQRLEQLSSLIEDQRSMVIHHAYVQENCLVEQGGDVEIIKIQDGNLFTVVRGARGFLKYVPEELSKTYRSQEEKQASIQQIIQSMESENAHLRLLLRTLTDHNDLNFLRNIGKNAEGRLDITYIEGEIPRLRIDSDGHPLPPTKDEKDGS